MGISEMQLLAIDGVRQVKKLLNGLYPLVLAIAVEDISDQSVRLPDAYESLDVRWQISGRA